MENRRSYRPQFDEREGLAQLERFRQDIERYRAKRKAASEEFEEFVRSFNNPQPSRDTQPAPEQPRKHIRERLPAPAPVLQIPETAASDATHESSVPTTHVSEAPARQRARSKTPVLLGSALVLVAVGGLVTWMARTRAPEPSTAAPLPDTRTAAPPPPSGATRPTVPSASSGAELTTSRRVWVRVLADGERVVEGELPADARVPLKAEKTIVIRAGNAGVVRLSLAGQDQGLLGPEGTVVTRTFTVPPAAPR